MTITDKALTLLADGKTYKEIAEELGTSEGSLRVLVWKRRNPEKNAAAATAWQRANPEAFKAAQKRYRLKVRANA